MNLLVVEQQRDAPAGLLGEWARERGARATTLRAPEVGDWPDPSPHGAVVALGSDCSVHASPEPWIAGELAFLRAAHDAGVPVLGVCFGAQALTAALGGTVTRAPEAEIGWVDVEGEAPEAGLWFSWHEDAIAPPPGARVRARTPVAAQAFTAGRSTGLQFHPEVTPAIVADWLRTGRGAIDTHGVDAAAVLRETRERASEARARAFALFDAVAARWTA
ncbi:MAG: type 1 glutamine amidotransferase [Solirubrobacteraceae bacterium]